jgi:hypothetical protein
MATITLSTTVSIELGNKIIKEAKEKNITLSKILREMIVEKYNNKTEVIKIAQNETK